jgi:phosphoadenosine phosphosulfate reductase
VLIYSPRLSDAERDAWAVVEAADLRRARDGRARLDRMVATSRQVIADYLATGARPHVGVSWGKDSVVTAWLTLSVDATLPLRWVRSRYYANPDCDAVRDAFLARCPCDYAEVIADDHVSGEVKTWMAALNREHRGRITGLRADESRARQLSAASHGYFTAESCRPVLRWTEADIFAALACFDLPTHPVYAMTGPGIWTRRDLRVSTIGYHEGIGMGRREWERRYYADVLALRAGLPPVR